MKKKLSKIYSKIIVRYSDKRAPLIGPLSEKGYLILPDYFNKEELNQFDQISNICQNGEKNEDILNRYPFLIKPLKDKKVLSIIKEYLGKYAILDYCCAERFWSKGPKSDVWHHDSVGHRIKLFLCLTDQDESTHTQIVPKSNLMQYSDYQNTRLNKDEILNNHEIVKLIGRKNDLILFDTNSMHIGVYSEKPRDIVQFEVSDIRKAMLRGHIGPRKSVFNKSIIESPLIAKHKLRSKGDTFCYE